jgi:hypothetical protein
VGKEETALPYFQMQNAAAAVWIKSIRWNLLRLAGYSESTKIEEQ